MISILLVWFVWIISISSCYFCHSSPILKSQSIILKTMENHFMSKISTPDPLNDKKIDNGQQLQLNMRFIANLVKTNGNEVEKGTLLDSRNSTNPTISDSLLSASATLEPTIPLQKEIDDNYNINYASNRLIRKFGYLISCVGFLLSWIGYHVVSFSNYIADFGNWIEKVGVLVVGMGNWLAMKTLSIPTNNNDNDNIN